MPPRRRARAALPLLLLAVAGCAGGPLARRGGGEEAAALPGWSVELAALLPAINACVDEADASGVTRAWGMARSLAGVRVVRGDGSRLDCVASGAGDKVVLVQPVAAGSQLADEAAPLYTPRDQRPPEGRCVATVPALVSERQVGWLSYGTCRPGEDGAGAAPPGGPSPRPRASPLAPTV